MILGYSQLYNRDHTYNKGKSVVLNKAELDTVIINPMISRIYPPIKIKIRGQKTNRLLLTRQEVSYLLHNERKIVLKDSIRIPVVKKIKIKSKRNLDFLKKNGMWNSSRFSKNKIRKSIKSIFKEWGNSDIGYLNFPSSNDINNRQIAYFLYKNYDRLNIKYGLIPV